MRHILLVDDQLWVRVTIETVLQAEGFKVTIAEDAVQAIGALQDVQEDEEEFDLIISDIIMPNVDGIELITGIRAQNIQTPVLFISGGGYNMDAEGILESARVLSNGVLHKPFTNEELMKAIETIFSAHNIDT